MENILSRRWGWHEGGSTGCRGAGGRAQGKVSPWHSVSSAERALLLHAHPCTHPAPVLQAA